MAPVRHVAPQKVPLGGDYWQYGYDIETDETNAVWGFADLHAHPLANIGFGGRMIFGKVDGPIDQALPWCTSEHGPGGVGLFAGRDPLSVIALNGLEIESGGGVGHLVGGNNEFDGWPRFTDLLHQRMYVDWVERAYLGGLRLMVAHVVNNEVLAELTSGSNYDDVTAVEAQIQGIKDLVGRHAFMEIAFTPEDARRIVAANMLAVVLGVEVDSLGNWARETDATIADVRTYLEHLYDDLGVRHIFPIHLANNAFGGTAVTEDFFNALNFGLRKEFLDVRTSDVDFELSDVSIAGIGKTYPHPHPGGHGNILGLTSLGLEAVRECMHLGMLIDIDHMSELAVEAALGLAETGGYPLVVGHTAFRELAPDGKRDDYQRTPAQLQRMLALGGMVAVGLTQQDMKDGGGGVANDAPQSAKTWAQAYSYAVRAMAPTGVAIGSDINGLSGIGAPRFGVNACYGIRKDGGASAERQAQRRSFVYAQQNGVSYATPIVDYRAYRWEGVLAGDVYSDDDRDAWESIAIFKSGQDPSTADMPGAFARNLYRSGKIKNVAKGMRASSPAGLENPPLGGNTFAEQKAGFLVSHGLDPASNDDAETKRLHGITKGIWERWHAMEGSNVPLTRSLIGRRDFDINIDGVAHYGLLPDFIQDLRNSGLTQQDLAPLFRSAEEYIRMWERCNRQRANFPTIAANGSLLQEPDGAVWVVYGHARFHVPDPATLDALFPGAPLQRVSASDLAGIATAPVDGTLLRETNGAIWVVYGGAKFHVPDPATLEKLFAGVPSHQLWDGALDGIPAIPIDGTLLREATRRASIYVVRGGFKTPAPAGSVGQVRVLWAGALTQIPTRPQRTRLPSLPRL